VGCHKSQLERWEQSADDFVAAYQRIPIVRRSESIDGGWSARQVLQHLLDDEILFSTRMRAAIASPGSSILPFDAERYQASLSYDVVPDEVLLDALFALRSVNIGLLRGLPDVVWDQTVVHPESGSQSVEQISVMFGDHIADHLSDLLRAGLDDARR
jgi:hypothetical protein